MSIINQKVFRDVFEQFQKEIVEMEKNVVNCCGLTFTQCNTITEIRKAAYFPSMCSRFVKSR